MGPSSVATVGLNDALAARVERRPEHLPLAPPEQWFDRFTGLLAAALCTVGPQNPVYPQNPWGQHRAGPTVIIRVLGWVKMADQLSPFAPDLQAYIA